VKIVIVRSGRLGGDGISRVIEGWARILVGAGHDVAVVAERGSGDPPFGMPGVREVGVEPCGGGRSVRLFSAADATVRAVRPLLAEGAGLIVSHDSLLAGRLRGAFPGAPILGTFHSPLVDENRLRNWKYAEGPGRRLTYPATRLIFWHLERRALKSVSAAHTLSTYTWDILRRRYPSVCRGVDWHRVPGSFDETRFAPAPDREKLRGRLGFAPEETVLLAVRRLVPRNGVDRIVRCAAELGERAAGVRFLIGGTGPLEGELRRQIAARGLAGRVQLLGFVPEDDLVRHYQAADAFVLPTRDLECFGLPVIEAMACGTVPLVMPDGGPVEICRDHPEWVAASNTDGAFTDLVARYVGGAIPRRPPGVAREAVERHSERAIGPLVLRAVRAPLSRVRAA
jgi:glycosyltransferase involved in cell wall biosynthesis